MLKLGQRIRNRNGKCGFVASITEKFVIVLTPDGRRSRLTHDEAAKMTSMRICQRYPVYEPTPRQIRAACEKIRRRRAEADR